MAEKIFGDDCEILLYKTIFNTRKKQHIITLKYASNNTIAVYLKGTPLRQIVRGSANIFKNRLLYLDFNDNTVIFITKNNRKFNGIYKLNHRIKQGVLDRGIFKLF